ncbi:CopY family transcriptional regulator [Rathayibacter sp. AY1A7]|nr:CopY family transcriptional regulator [Rathayibacter sp. AY1A7]
MQKAAGAAEKPLRTRPPRAAADELHQHQGDEDTVTEQTSEQADITGAHGYISDKDQYLRRLRRIEGQARGLQNMVEDEQYCIKILTQISAMTSALESVALGLLNDHLNHCVLEAAAAGGDDAKIKLQEASDAIARLVRS